MKFCPECGYETLGKDFCPSCGFNLKDLNKEVKKDESKHIFDFEIEKKFREIDFKDKTIVPLEELKSYKFDYGELLTFSYNSYGGMEGKDYVARIDFKEKTFMIQSQPSHMADITRTVYKADDDTLDKIKKFIEDINLPVWSKIEINTMFRAYDAPSSNTSVVYSKKGFTINGLIFKDDEEVDLLNELSDLVYSLKDDNNKLSEDVIPKGENKTWPAPGSMNGFIGMGMMMPNNMVQGTEPNTFCPECGAPRAKGSKNCACGFTYKD